MNKKHVQARHHLNTSSSIQLSNDNVYKYRKLQLWQVKGKYKLKKIHMSFDLKVTKVLNCTHSLVN